MSHTRNKELFDLDTPFVKHFFGLSVMAEIFILEGKVSYCFILVIAFLANSVAFSES